MWRLKQCFSNKKAACTVVYGPLQNPIKARFSFDSTSSQTALVTTPWTTKLDQRKLKKVAYADFHRCTVGQRQTYNDYVIECAVVIKKNNSWHFVADQVNLFLTTMFRAGYCIYQHDNTPCNASQIIREWLQKTSFTF